MGLYSSHGEEARRVLALLRQLPPAQQRHGFGHLPAAEHDGFLFQEITGSLIFSKIDLSKGYYKIPMHPADILKTTIITLFGLFEFLHLTFGLRNAGSTFQLLMDRVLAGLAFAFVYLDDIIIASSSLKQHQPDVEEVFHHLHVAGLIINFEKCTFAGLWISWAPECPPAVSPPSPAEWPQPEVSAAVYGQVAARLSRSFQLLQALCSSSSEDPPAPH
jgi:hypothetical protein